MTDSVYSMDFSSEHEDGFMQQDKPFELKINITDSEMIVVEDPTYINSPALILKNTMVLSYRPSFIERPLSCNLSNCEVYSCLLSAEQESALSILDPVVVNIDMMDRGSKTPDLASGAALTLHHVVEISFHQINLRLSYHDLKMFQRILSSDQWLSKDSKSMGFSDSGNFQVYFLIQYSFVNIFLNFC